MALSSLYLFKKLFLFRLEGILWFVFYRITSKLKLWILFSFMEPLELRMKIECFGLWLRCFPILVHMFSVFAVTF